MENIIDGAQKINLYDYIIRGRFIIPIYQRTYDWGEKQIIPFIDDLLYSMENRKKIYLGVLVLKGDEDSVKYEVIDGQQRILTLIILLRVLANSRGISNKEKENIKKILTKLYLNSKETKVIFNLPEVQNFFSEYILKNNKEYPLNKKLSIIKRILNAEEILTEKLDGMKRIGRFYAYLKEGLEAVYILTKEEDAVYDIFESINSKKLGLAISDLTKNILLKKCKYENNKKYDLASQKITELVRIFEDSPKQTSEFLKTYWAAKYELPRRKFYELYKSSPQFKRGNPIKLIDDLIFYSKEYKKIINPSESDWPRKKSNKGVLQTLEEIEFLNLKTPRPLLLQLLVQHKTKKIQINNIFKKILSLSFLKIIVLKERPGILEMKYSTWAKKIFRREKSIQDLYVEINKEVRKEFGKAKELLMKPIFTLENKELKYLLYKIYQRRFGQNLNIVQIKLDNISKDSIEHILPKKPEKWLQEIKLDISSHNLARKGITNNEDYLNRFCYQLGNLILLSSIDNSKIGNLKFLDKKKKYIQYEKNNPLFEEIIDRRVKVWSSIEIEKRTFKLVEELKRMLTK